MMAAKANNLTLIKLLSQKELKMQDKMGRTALMYACEEGNYDAFMELVRDEYDIRDIADKHALHYAVHKDAVQIVEAVVDTFIEVVDNSGTTTLMEAAKSNAI